MVTWVRIGRPIRSLKLDMYSVENTIKFSVDFYTESDFIVERDPDYRPPPGATLVPEGSYVIGQSFLGSGRIEPDGKIYRGSIEVDFTQITHFPDPVINQGSLAYRSVGHFVSENNLQICLDVFEGGYEDAVNDPFNHLAPNCRWPGYIFTCTPKP